MIRFTSALDGEGMGEMDDVVTHLRSVPDTGSESAQPIRTHHGGGSLRSRAFTLGMRLTVRPVISA
ncbi:hypothetical protein, partial [Nocardioides sp.]|uniref:hypothetical protein n=1 Tax=Nocardioides sp. TaxID=35761 RepID=UPI002736B0FB